MILNRLCPSVFWNDQNTLTGSESKFKHDLSTATVLHSSNSDLSNFILSIILTCPVRLVDTIVTYVIFCFRTSFYRNTVKLLVEDFPFFFVFISRREWAIFTYLYFLPSYYFLFFKYRNRFSPISYFEFKEYFWFWYIKLKFKYASRFVIFWLTHLWMLQF